MANDLIGLLKSSDPDDRIAGVQQLMDVDHPNAKTILDKLYKRETDARVKEAITAAEIELESASTKPPPSKKKVKNKPNPENAQELLQKAGDTLIAGSPHQARVLLAQAVRHDPALRKDTYAIGLAAEITGLPPEKAVDELLQTTALVEKDKFHITWLDGLLVIIYVALWGIVVYDWFDFFGVWGGPLYSRDVLFSPFWLILLEIIFVMNHIMMGICNFFATKFFNKEDSSQRFIYELRYPLLATPFLFPILILPIMLYANFFLLLCIAYILFGFWVGKIMVDTYGIGIAEATISVFISLMVASAIGWLMYFVWILWSTHLA